MLTARGYAILERRYRTRQVASSGYQVEVQDTVIGVHSTRAAWAAEMASRIELDLATRAPRYTFVHAGVVSWHGAAILVPGASGTGKSTTAYSSE